MPKNEIQLVIFKLGEILIYGMMLAGFVSVFAADSNLHATTPLGLFVILVITFLIFIIVLKTFRMINVLIAIKFEYKNMIGALGPKIQIVEKKSEIYQRGPSSYVAIMVENGPANQPVYLKKCDDCWGVGTRYRCYTGVDYFISRRYLLLIDRYIDNHYLFEMR